MKLLFVAILATFKVFVIPAQFQDRSFESGHADLAALTASAQDYFNKQFAGEKTFSFEIGDIITLPNTYSYYGANYTDRHDVLINEAIREAHAMVGDKVSLSGYDAVMLLTAGPSEASSSDPDDIWPQYTEKTAITTEKAGLGIFCHEFGHALGLPDLYDTDGDGSGGNAPALWETGLMDTGCRKGTVPAFSALDHELLGIGKRDSLTIGHHNLLPIENSHRYLRYGTHNKGEFFLFEARQEGMLIYHVDRSTSAAGYSDYYKVELNAFQRWQRNQINCRPDRQCAAIVPAKADAKDISEIFFNERNASFGSNTTPSFRAWDGTASKLAIIGIHKSREGGISFDVIEPMKPLKPNVFQDAALLAWELNPLLEDNQGYTISWTDGRSFGKANASPDATCYTLEGLKPKTTYTVTVSLKAADGAIFSFSQQFTTKVKLDSTFPFIYLNDADRLPNGNFKPGARFPLRVFNASDVHKVEWFFSERRIEAGADGCFSPPTSGILKAEVTYKDGSRDIIIKEVRL